MEITVEKNLCEGCKGAFKELENVQLKFETLTVCLAAEC